MLFCGCCFKIPDEDFSTLIKYLEGLKGSSREKTVKMAEQKMEENSGDYFADIQYMTYIQWLHDIHAMVT